MLASLNPPGVCTARATASPSAAIASEFLSVGKMNRLSPAREAPRSIDAAVEGLDAAGYDSDAMSMPLKMCLLGLRLPLWGGRPVLVLILWSLFLLVFSSL